MIHWLRELPDRGYLPVPLLDANVNTHSKMQQDNPNRSLLIHRRRGAMELVPPTSQQHSYRVQGVDLTSQEQRNPALFR